MSVRSREALERLIHHQEAHKEGQELLGAPSPFHDACQKKAQPTRDQERRAQLCDHGRERERARSLELLLKPGVVGAAERADNVYITSALSGAGVPEFLDAVSRQLTPDQTQSELSLGFEEGRARAWLFEQGLVSTEQQTQEGFLLSISWTARQKKAFSDLFGPKLVSGS